MTHETNPQKVTFREFQMWLDGLLTGNEDRKSLPTLEQWRAIVAKLDLVETTTPLPPTYVPYPVYPQRYDEPFQPYQHLLPVTCYSQSDHS
jgi:hypothetical protein